MKQRLDYGGTQDRGRRPYQEDAFHILPNPDGKADSLFMLVSDGMGGHQGGAHASAAAVQAFTEAYLAASEPEAERLQSGLIAANQRIARDSVNPELRGMGCTLLGVSLMSDGLRLISVGDSPAFLYRNGRLTRLNADHSMAPVLQQAVLLGTLRQEDVACHPNRHALRSAVMGRELSLVDLRREPMEVLPGDKLLMASDGILTLSEAELAELLSQQSDRTAEEVSRLLVEAVNRADDPHQDNVTVVVATLSSVDAGSLENASDPANERQASRSLAGGLLAGGRLPDRRATGAALRALLQPRILATLGAAFLVAAVAVGAITTWLHRSMTSSPAVPDVTASVQSASSQSPPAAPEVPRRDAQKGKAGDTSDAVEAVRSAPPTATGGDPRGNNSPSEALAGKEHAGAPPY